MKHFTRCRTWTDPFDSNTADPNFSISVNNAITAALQTSEARVTEVPFSKKFLNILLC
jgi:hypothetical protein